MDNPEVPSGWKLMQGDKQQDNCSLTVGYKVSGWNEACDVFNKIEDILREHGDLQMITCSLHDWFVMLAINGLADVPLTDEHATVASELDKRLNHLEKIEFKRVS